MAVRPVLGIPLARPTAGQFLILLASVQEAYPQLLQRRRPYTATPHRCRSHRLSPHSQTCYNRCITLQTVHTTAS